MRCRLGHDREVDVTSEDELNRLVAECLARGDAAPFLLECTGETGDVLDVAFAPDRCVLLYTSASGEPPYLISVGVEGSDGIVSYLVDDEPTEFAIRNTVPPEHAIQALQRFLRTSTPPDNVMWEET